MLFLVQIRCFCSKKKVDLNFLVQQKSKNWPLTLFILLKSKDTPQKIIVKEYKNIVVNTSLLTKLKPHGSMKAIHSLKQGHLQKKAIIQLPIFKLKLLVQIQIKQQYGYKFLARIKAITLSK